MQHGEELALAWVLGATVRSMPSVQERIPAVQKLAPAAKLAAKDRHPVQEAQACAQAQRAAGRAAEVRTPLTSMAGKRGPCSRVTLRTRMTMLT